MFHASAAWLNARFYEQMCTPPQDNLLRLLPDVDVPDGSWRPRNLRFERTVRTPIRGKIPSRDKFACAGGKKLGMFGKKLELGVTRFDFTLTKD